MASKKKKRLPERGPQCDCINMINESIAKEVHPNLQLKTGFNFTAGCSWIVIPLEKKDDSIRMPPGKNVKHMTASFCPFCGKKYKP